jgi:hypothetical protein
VRGARQEGPPRISAGAGNLARLGGPVGGAHAASLFRRELSVAVGDTSAREYMSKALYWGSLFFALAFGGYCLVKTVVIAVGADTSGHRTLGGVDRFGLTLLYLAFVGGAFLTWWRLGRTRVTVTADAVTVRNPIRTTVLPRRDVVRWGVTSGRTWVFLTTTAGRRIVCWGLSYGARWTLTKRMKQVARETGIPFM